MKIEHTYRVVWDPDYVRCPKFGNSLSRFSSKNPNGVDDAMIARLLLISVEDVARIYREAVEMLRAEMLK